MDIVPLSWVISLVPALVVFVWSRSLVTVFGVLGYVTLLIWLRLGEGALFVWALFWCWALYKLTAVLAKAKVNALTGGKT